MLRTPNCIFQWSQALGFRRNHVVFPVVVEHWTSSKPSTKLTLTQDYINFFITTCAYV